MTHPFRTLLLASALTMVGATLGAQTQTLKIWPGVAPGSEHWTQTERTYENTPVGTVVMNVVTPTITAFLPDPANATGTAVIVAPGGGFVALAVTQEGDAARWLQQRGIAAFLLKYRTVEKKFEGIPRMDMDTAGRYGIADGIQAMKVVREHAREWGIDPHRVGILGFSAGAMVASGVLLQKDSASRPDFAAMIYGGPFGKMPPIPSNLPPTFMAWASDDNVALAPTVRFHDALVAAGAAPDTHVYRTGGHGFGMLKQGKESDRWTDDFQTWLTARHLTGKAPRHAR